MSVRIGINPITWTNDDMPELGGDTPVDTCLSEAKQAGYSGIEMGGKFPKEANAMKALMAKHHLALISGWYSGHAHNNDVRQEFGEALPHLELLKANGCQYVVYADTSGGAHSGIDTPISNRPKLPEGEWKEYGRKLTELAEKMADFGVRMAFHHHMGTVVESDAEVDKLMANTGQAVGLLFDSGHSAFSGGDPVALCKRHVKRIVHVHCKDSRKPILDKARKSDESFLRAVLDGIFTVPGDGQVDFQTILNTLQGAGYAGWLVVEAEQDPAKAHPLTYAKMGYENLQRMASKAGFQIAA
ncbi:MAG TPA: myo-inosose-2 dehydratase [Candidatus Cybelea sp.]|nr:myo-inosose-2 dehydratase [Candidatus Cybelea sp.]